VVNQPLRRSDWKVTPTNHSVDEPVLNLHPTNNSTVNNLVTEPNPLDASVNEEVNMQPDDPSDGNQAKKRKILLEMQLEVK
jgi:hypothetical protein